MESSLTKSQLCWIIVRVIGLVFLFSGINLVVSAFLPWLFYGSGVLEPSGMSGSLFLLCVARLSLAYYFLGRGIRVHRLLMFESALPGARIDSEKAALDSGTGMAAEELELFREWRDANPSINYLKIETQVARYRDSKSE